MASQSSRPRLTPTLPHPTRGQIVWWVVGGVVAVAAVVSVAFNMGDGTADQSDGPVTVEDPVTLEGPASATGEVEEQLPLAA